MIKILKIFILLALTQNVKAQVASNSNQHSVGTKFVIKALPYTNDINKYYFNKNKINELANFLKNNPSVYIEINCFSDFKDSPMMSLMASSDQASDIQKYLISLGIQGSRIEPIGNGEMFPIYEDYQLDKMTSEKRKSAELENRRIEITITKK